MIDVCFLPPFFVCLSLSQVNMSMYKKKSAKSLPPENANLLPVNIAPKSLKAHKAASGNLYTPAGHFVQPFKPGVSSTSKKADPFQPLATTLTFENEGDTVQIPGKKQKQFQRWETEVLPSLMEPYVKLLHETDSLRDMVQVRSRRQCTGCESGRQLNVACIFFERMCSSIFQQVTNNFGRY